MSRYNPVSWQCDMLSSLLHGWRSWKSSRAVALLAVAALAIGIGSATAIFSVIQAVPLNPLPYAGAERYYQVFARGARTRICGRSNLILTLSTTKRTPQL